LLHVPYWTMAGSLLVGQFISAVAGVLLVKALKRVWMHEDVKAVDHAGQK